MRAVKVIQKMKRKFWEAFGTGELGLFFILHLEFESDCRPGSCLKEEP